MSPVPVDVDVVVAGSGATGLAAAVTLAEGGATVAVFEKQRALGGTSNFFRGTFAVESEMQRERFIDYSRDDAFRNIMEYSHWKANARLVRAIVDESAATIAWLEGPRCDVHRPDDNDVRARPPPITWSKAPAKRWSRPSRLRRRARAFRSCPERRSWRSPRRAAASLASWSTTTAKRWTWPPAR